MCFVDSAMTIGRISDEELMARLARGDMSALGQLVHRHQQKVLALAYRILGKWDGAEDVCQETFLRLHKVAKTYTPRAKFTTWLYRIVVNLCFDEQRKSARHAVPLEDVGSNIKANPSDNSLEKKELAAIVQNAINKLPERQRLAVVLHRYDGLSHEEISKVTGWTKSAVESLLVRAYTNLREKLGKMKDFVK